jgi:uncharacterized membrane protein
MVALIVGLIVFLGLHSISILAPGWRARAIQRFGEGAWKGLYSVLSLAGFVLMLVGFAQARAGAPVLYVPPAALRYLTFLLMLPVFPLLLAAYLPGSIQARARHPMLASVKLWATAHLLAIGTLPDVLLFGSFLVWAVIDRISVKHRAPGPPRRAVAVPHADLIAVVAGLALYGLFLWKLHAWLIGVAPLAPPH